MRRILICAAVSLAALLGWLAGGCVASPAFAQVTVPQLGYQAPVTGAVPRLSSAQGIAIGVTGQLLAAKEAEYNAALEQLHEIEAEVAHDHPGYHFDENSGAVERDQPLKKNTPASNAPKFWERR
jgi:hypothetical protein